MRELFAVLLLCAFAVLLPAQTPAAADRITSQEVSEVLTRISQNAGRVAPMLDQLRVTEWVSKGASETYTTQWNSTKSQFASIQADMTSVAQHPEQMVEGMKALFRIETAHRMLGSLMGGLRRYQNPALAELIESVAAEDRANQEKLQQYLLELGSEKEQQLEVMNVEAQRCRAVLSKQPAVPARRPAPPGTPQK